MRAPALVFCAALALRLPVLLSLARQPATLLRSDSEGYLRPAQSLLRQGAFSESTTTPYAPEANRTPGYPLFLAAHEEFSESPVAPATTQIALDAASAALAGAAAAALTGQPAAAAAGLLYALDPVAAAHAPLLLTETLFTFLLTLCVFLLVRRREPGWPAACAAGLCLGAATLVRPISLYLWLPWSAALAWAWRGKARRAALAFAACAVVLPSAWCARNAAVFGHFEFSSITGVNALLWEAAAVQASADGTSLADGRARLVAELARRHPEPSPDPFEESRLRRRLAAEVVAEHPLRFVRLQAASTVKMLAGPGLDLIAEVFWPGEPRPTEENVIDSVSGSGTFAVLKSRPQLWLALVSTGLILALTYGLALLGARVLWRRRDGRAAAILVTPLAYLLLVSAGGWSYYRFRLPLMPPLAILAALSLPLEKRR